MTFFKVLYFAQFCDEICKDFNTEKNYGALLKFGEKKCFRPKL
jgi:hypothetical protein